jgi:hypothetical protein
MSMLMIRGMRMVVAVSAVFVAVGLSVIMFVIVRSIVIVFVIVMMPVFVFLSVFVFVCHFASPFFRISCCCAFLLLPVARCLLPILLLRHSFQDLPLLVSYFHNRQS